MVIPSLSIGAVVGVLLSAAFVYAEVGRYATPQVPVTLFDERREIFAYTAGLFVGIPFAVALLLYLVSMENAALISAILFLAILVVGVELAQRYLLRSRYWGRSPAEPFYALGFRAALGGILALALIASYLSFPSLTWDGIALVLLQAVAVVALQVTGALLSLPPSLELGTGGAGPVSGGVFCAVAFFLLGLGPLAGEAGGFLGAALVVVGSFVVYRRRRAILARVPAPTAGPPPETPERATPYRRRKAGTP